jgi:hypothetical protein
VSAGFIIIVGAPCMQVHADAPLHMKGVQPLKPGGRKE